MKVVIAKKKCGGLKILKLTHHNQNKFGDPPLLPFTEWKLLKETLKDPEVIGWFPCEWDKVKPLKEKSKLVSEGFSRSQLYHDGDKVCFDEKWDHRVMPDHVIRKKHIDKAEAELDAELSKETPDAVKVIQAKRECEKCQKMSSLELHELALSKIEKRAKTAEGDKPKIRKQLEAKIKELKNA